MSAEAASLPCPICSRTGVFQSVQSLRDKLIAVSTNKITCPVCQEEVIGIDKLTIHLFSHVNLVSKNEDSYKNNPDVSNPNPKPIKQTVNKVQQKKSKPMTAKNKTTTTPVKFVKIFPKLPVIALNPVSVIDNCSQPSNGSVQASKSIYIPAVKTEASHPVTQTNTTCNVCGLQFVDANILRMHKLLIHNIEENSNITSTRYHCHICPKNFKMRGSLMVHLRVAHFGFPTNTNETDSHTEKSHEHSNQVTDDKPANIERNDNKQWQCDVCRKCFTTKYFLKKHKRLHTGETPYACTQCNKTFTFQQSYHKHLLYHNDEKPHVCSYCGRAFKELSTLHNHQRIHTGEKPFSCETCGKCFRQRVSYLVHRRIHTGVMPYKCTACDKSFRYKVSQRTHKCQAQPPGTVVRQSGDLVEKLRKKCDESVVSTNGNQKQFNSQAQDLNDGIPKTVTEVSEANAELVLVGAKLSLEDMESESFTLIAEAFNETNNETDQPSTSYDTDNGTSMSKSELPFNELIESGKNVPSPSEIFEKLCLSKDDDYINDLPDVNESNCKDFDIFL